MLKLCKMSYYLELHFMALKLLIFGLPGGGKSTIAHSIMVHLKVRNWESFHLSDHVILSDMFMADIEYKQFKLTDHGGFDVTDFTVFDIALKKLELIVKMHLLHAQEEEVVLIEFARNDYRWAFQQFSAKFLLDAYFLYLDVNLETCKKRIRERIINPRTQDDFYVSDNIFNSYYGVDVSQSIDIEQVLIETYGIEKKRVKVIENNGLFSCSIAKVYSFVDTMCDANSNVV